MPKFDVEIHVEVDAPDGDEAFRIVHEEYAIVHDPNDTIKSEQFHVEEAIEIEEDEEDDDA